MIEFICHKYIKLKGEMDDTYMSKNDEKSY